MFGMLLECCILLRPLVDYMFCLAGNTMEEVEDSGVGEESGTAFNQVEASDDNEEEEVLTETNRERGANRERQREREREKERDESNNMSMSDEAVHVMYCCISVNFTVSRCSNQLSG